MTSCICLHVSAEYVCFGRSCAFHLARLTNLSHRHAQQCVFLNQEIAAFLKSHEYLVKDFPSLIEHVRTSCLAVRSTR